ncbi:hypothetical protein N658DRAFT_417524 [Parathielavia hyrcaniae]|uniref:DUF7603 domain-containing protein n=1 Tax=Parathielavia hyrcaniae TaxID=113614 RepID=A0AAN6Q8C1_9PEZI|nr:hypothetical protein N658DRAFT_417524 [Parathielavia hyrcaniae]
MAAPSAAPDGKSDLRSPAHHELDLDLCNPHSDTPTASSDLASARTPPRPATLPASLETVDYTGSFPDVPPLPSKHPLPSPRTGRSFSLAQPSGPIKRKPLSSTASPAAVRFSKGAAYADAIADLPRPEQRFARSCSLDSPTLYEFPDHRSLLATASSLNTVVDWPTSRDTSQRSSFLADSFSRPAVPVDGAKDVHLSSIAGSNPATTHTTHTLGGDDVSLSAETTSVLTEESTPYELDDLYSIPGSPEPHGYKRATITKTNAKTMSMSARKSPPPQLNLGPNTRDVPDTTSATALEQTHLNKPLPKSPASSKLSTYFGWATSPSPTTATDYSDKNFSPLPSPESPKPATAVTESYGTPIKTKGPIFVNATEQSSLQYCEAYLQTPADSTTSLGQLEEMEDELRAISAELASSIRREMDLEDIVDRLQEQISNPQAPGRRTSDYFSDSGYSSAKFSDYDQAKDEISQIQRKAEQEKAQIRLELTNKLQDERSKRRLLDQQIQELSKKASQLDVAQLNTDDSGRVKELESMCEDLSRRLSEERQVKNNFEDLLGVLKGELQTASNERDNLRDEIVPQLRARVEGLEAEATEHARLTYDTSKMQQELRLLRSENAELKHTAPRMSIAESISELKQTTPRMSTGLSRSASVTGGSFGKTRPLRQQSLSRSNTTRSSEPRDVLAERLKDVEAQRDALHSALKSLLERQDLQNRENSKRIRQLEMERDRLLTATPKKAGYEREVSILRDEISVLRRRAEEAIEQKWLVEKGLAGLKMDLDRAVGEIASLQSLLREKDILIPEALARPGSSHSVNDGAPVSSDSLEQAYKDLQTAYLDALERIKSLEENTRTDEKTQFAMEHLERSLSAAVSDRDLARTEASAYRDQLGSHQTVEKQHLDSERDLAAQLHESARRVEELAQQVRSQLETNATLRTRLADTIARGDAEQRVNKDRIAGMQARLRSLEDQVVAAQTAAEERVARHEEDVAALRGAHSVQLHRLRDQRRVFPPKSPFSPIFSLNAAPRSIGGSGKSQAHMSTPPPNLLLKPHLRLSSQRARPAGAAGAEEQQHQLSAEDMSAQMETLKRRVAELEGALASADGEMQEVVGRMSAAQIEVLRLQEEREEAVRETRRLRKQVEEEKVKVFDGRWRGLVGAGMVG